MAFYWSGLRFSWLPDKNKWLHRGEFYLMCGFINDYWSLFAKDIIEETWNRRKIVKKSFVGLKSLWRKNVLGWKGRPHTAMRIFPSSLNKIKSTAERKSRKWEITGWKSCLQGSVAKHCHGGVEKSIQRVPGLQATAFSFMFLCY